MGAALQKGGNTAGDSGSLQLDRLKGDDTIMLTYFSLMDTETQKTKFEQIYREQGSRMLSLAFGILGDSYGAEDAVHDAFVRIACNMDTVERLNDWQVRRYVLTAAKHAAIDLYRKRNREAACEISLDALETKAVIDGPVSELENTVLQEVKHLPGPYREVFLLKYSLCLTNEEMAELLGLSVSGVRQRLTRGKELLRKALAEEQRG